MRRDNCDTGPDEKVLQAIEEMKFELGEHFSLEKLNLAELGRRTGISRMKLRRLKKNGFASSSHGAWANSERYVRRQSPRCSGPRHNVEVSVDSVEQTF